MNRKTGINWSDVRQRLRESEAALDETMNRSGDELTTLFNRRADQLARRQLSQVKSVTTPVLVFTIGQERYGVELSELIEVRMYHGATPVPESTAALLGLMNVRGEIRPVLDLARLLNVEREATDSGGYVLMIRTAGDAIGVRVDRIEHVRDLQQNELTTVPAGSAANTRHAKAVTADSLMLLNAAALVQKVMTHA